MGSTRKVWIGAKHDSANGRLPNARLLLPEARWCDTFIAKLRGFIGRREIGLDEGLVLVYGRESRMDTAVHMLFVFCNLGIIWVNAQGTVVDKKIAQPWRPAYIPQQKAQYVIELHPQHLDGVNLGDHISFGEGYSGLE